MSSDAPNKATVQTLKLLKAYPNKPARELQEQLLQLTIALVRTEIRNSIAGDSTLQCPSATGLVALGKCGFVSAVRNFDLHSQQTFQDFALPYIHASLQGRNKHLLPPEAQARSPDASEAQMMHLRSNNTQCEIQTRRGRYGVGAKRFRKSRHDREKGA